MESASTSVSPDLQVDEHGIGWITFDDPTRKLNVLTEPVMRRLAEVVEEVRAAAIQGRVRVAVIRSGKPDSFIAGADVDAIASVEDPGVADAQIRLGQAIFMDVETLPVPTVAESTVISALNGVISPSP